MTMSDPALRLEKSAIRFQEMMETVLSMPVAKLEKLAADLYKSSVVDIALTNLLTVLYSQNKLVSQDSTNPIDDVKVLAGKLKDLGYRLTSYDRTVRFVENSDQAVNPEEVITKGEFDPSLVSGPLSKIKSALIADEALENQSTRDRDSSGNLFPVLKAFDALVETLSSASFYVNEKPLDKVVPSAKLDKAYDALADTLNREANTTPSHKEIRVLNLAGSLTEFPSDSIRGGTVGHESKPIPVSAPDSLSGVKEDVGSNEFTLLVSRRDRKEVMDLMHEVNRGMGAEKAPSFVGTVDIMDVVTPPKFKNIEIQLYGLMLDKVRAYVDNTVSNVGSKEDLEGLNDEFIVRDKGVTVSVRIRTAAADGKIDLVNWSTVSEKDNVVAVVESRLTSVLGAKFDLPRTMSIVGTTIQQAEKLAISANAFTVLKGSPSYTAYNLYREELRAAHSVAHEDATLSVIKTGAVDVLGGSEDETFPVAAINKNRTFGGGLTELSLVPVNQSQFSGYAVFDQDYHLMIVWNNVENTSNKSEKEEKEEKDLHNELLSLLNSEKSGITKILSTLTNNSAVDEDSSDPIYEPDVESFSNYGGGYNFDSQVFSLSLLDKAITPLASFIEGINSRLAEIEKALGIYRMVPKELNSEDVGSEFIR